MKGTAYRVIGDLCPEFPQLATTAMRRYSFQPVNDERGERESFGWVNPRALLASKWSYDDLVDGALVRLCIRHDRKSLSPRLLKARVAQEIARHETTKGKLAPHYRLQVAEEIELAMLRQTSAASSFYDLLWDMSAEIVVVSAPAGAQARIAEFFDATFDLKLEAA